MCVCCMYTLHRYNKFRQPEGDWLVALPVCLTVCPVLHAVSHWVCFTLCLNVYHWMCFTVCSAVFGTFSDVQLHQIQPQIAQHNEQQTAQLVWNIRKTCKFSSALKLYLPPVVICTLRNWLGTTIEGWVRWGGVAEVTKRRNPSLPILVSMGVNCLKGAMPSYASGKMPCRVLYRLVPLVTDACYTWPRKQIWKCTSARSRFTCELTKMCSWW